ncbi:unnamed protein product, partial [Allacma fusca]
MEIYESCPNVLRNIVKSAFEMKGAYESFSYKADLKITVILQLSLQFPCIVGQVNGNSLSLDGNSSNLNHSTTSKIGIIIEHKSNANNSVESYPTNNNYSFNVSAVPKKVNFVGPLGTPEPSSLETEEDKKVRLDWAGNCTASHWVTCSNQTYFGQLKNTTTEHIPRNKNCTDQRFFPPLCLRNGWTVTKCHLWCMAKLCNR